MRGGEHVRDATLLEFALQPPNLSEEIVDVLEFTNLVHEHELLRRAPAENLAHGGDRVRQALHLDAVAQGGDPRVLAERGREDDAGRVDELDVLIQHDLLAHLGHARGVAHRRRAALRFSELISDDLPTFGKPTIPTVMAVLSYGFARVVLQQLQQRLRPERILPAVPALGGKRARAQLIAPAGAAATGGALERHAGHLLAEVLEPRLDVLLGREVDLVEQEDDRLSGLVRRTNRSTSGERHARGSRASSTWMMTSDTSTTLTNSL